MKKNNLLTTTILLILIFSGKTWAAPIIFTDRIEWENALAGPIFTEDFSDKTSFSNLSSGTNSAGLVAISVIDNLGGTNASGNNFYSESFRGSSQTMTNGFQANTVSLVLPSNFSAFAMDISDISGGGLSLAFGSNLINVTNGFFGIVDDANFYSNVEFRCTTCGTGINNWGNVTYGIDNVSFSNSNAVPEPSVILLLSAGIFGLVLSGRRQKQLS